MNYLVFKAFFLRARPVWRHNWAQKQPRQVPARCGPASNRCVGPHPCQFTYCKQPVCYYLIPQHANIL